MSGDDWLKSLLMLPGRLDIAAREAATRIKHDRLNTGGDPAKRAGCCGPRPDSFAEGSHVADIPELKDILKSTGFLGNAYFPAYRCTVCGQEWFQDWEQLKFGGYIHVRKAT
jgi:hypothetical protein